VTIGAAGEPLAIAVLSVDTSGNGPVSTAEKVTGTDVVEPVGGAAVTIQCNVIASPGRRTVARSLSRQQEYWYRAGCTLTTGAWPVHPVTRIPTASSVAAAEPPRRRIKPPVPPWATESDQPRTVNAA